MMEGTPSVNERMRVLVAGDDPEGSATTSRLLAADTDLDVLGVCPDIATLPDVILKQRPDVLLFLILGNVADVVSPLLSLGEDRLPSTIFVADSDRYALQAIQVHALDYLLRPFGQERLRAALRRARKDIHEKRTASISRQVLSAFMNGNGVQERIDRVLVKSGGRISFVRAADIDWVEAQGDYVRIYVQGKKHLVREKIGDLEHQLPSQLFLRIHRSTIVNIDRVKEIQPLLYGEYSVVLHDGTHLTLSRSYRERVFHRFISLC